MDDKETFIVQSDTPDRHYVKVYHDFLDSDVLDRNEKMVFILLKRYLDFREDRNGIEGQAYPTLETLCKQCGMSKGAVIRSLKSLQKKKVLEIEQRGLNKPNLYTIKDYASVWKSETQEEMSMELKQHEFEKIERMAKEYGYKLIKEKELASAPVKVTETSPHNYQFDKANTTLKSSQSQYVERYSMEQINHYFNYSAMINDYPSLQADIDSIFNILYNTLNTNKETIKISGEEKLSMVVISKLMKLNYESILYSIRKFKGQTERIHNATNYMLTILYSAEEQMHLDITNLVQHNMNKNDNE